MNRLTIHALIKLATMCFTIFVSSISFACTNFIITAKDGSIINARSMEFAQDLNSNLRSSPQGRNFKTTTADGKPGLSWTAKYGYVYLDGMGVDMSVDGMNEKGLSYGALYLPGLAQYQTAPANQNSKVLPYYFIGDWILSNFATVDEVRKAVQNIYVVAAPIPSLPALTLPLHFTIHDTNGNSIVLEYVGGNLTVYDNKVGVLTNCPEFDWHTTNLNNYVNLKPTNPNPIVIKDLTFVATGQGSGMLGLPGDISPPSRFVKMSVFKAVVLPANDALTTVNLAEHMINNVDIPFGLAREPSSDNYTSEYTQWTVFKDITNKKFYYKTYDNPALSMVDMTKLDFSSKGPTLKMPINTKSEYIDDVTNKFVKAQ